MSAAGHVGASGGTAGTNVGGHGGTHAISGAAGEAGESSGGAANGAAGSDDEGGAAGASSGAGSGGASAGTGGAANGGATSGGTAGASGGTAGSTTGGAGGTSAGAGGAANGGATSGGASGNGGISGLGGSGGGAAQCGAAAQTAYASGFVAYFNAHIATTGCLAPQTHGADATQTQECASNGCGANAGCSATFTWHDVSFDAGTFSAQVDIASALAVTGAATCTLNDAVANETISAKIVVADNGTSLGTSFNSLGASAGTPTVSGCQTLTNAADIAADDLSVLVQQAEQAAVGTFLTYSVDCTP